jgi:hypothetical protein
MQVCPMKKSTVNSQLFGHRLSSINIIDARFFSSVLYTMSIVQAYQTSTELLIVGAMLWHFSQQESERFHRKLPTVNSMSNQPVLWTSDISYMKVISKQHIPHWYIYIYNTWATLMNGRPNATYLRVIINGVSIGDSIYWPLIYSWLVVTFYRSLTHTDLSSSVYYSLP